MCLLVSCSSSEAPKARPIGEAFVGPAALPIRSELSLRSPVVATLKHGEKLEVLQVRRRFLRVRNMGGTEGWLDGKNLLSTPQMTALERTITQAAEMPSQGRATVFEALNIHTEPNRQSPSPFQIPAAGSVDVLAHIVTPRVAYQSPMSAIITPTPKPPVAKKPKKKKAKKGQPVEAVKEEEKPEMDPPPMPAPPKLPENWQDLSKTDLPDDDKPSPRTDDWTLVRTPDKKAGWVLTRMLLMGIPDEVAQYAEGKRIMAYFPLGEVIDEEKEQKKKNHWMWATLSKPLQEHDFDGIRVFIYNLRRHRYETAYIEREIKGFYPILTSTVNVTENRKTYEVPGFSVITEDENGQRWKRTFAFQGYRVRMIQKEAIAKPKEMFGPSAIPTALPPPPAPPPENKSLWRRVKSVFGR